MKLNFLPIYFLINLLFVARIFPALDSQESCSSQDSDATVAYGSDNRSSLASKARQAQQDREWFRVQLGRLREEVRVFEKQLRQERRSRLFRELDDHFANAETLGDLDKLQDHVRAVFARVGITESQKELVELGVLGLDEAASAKRKACIQERIERYASELDDVDRRDWQFDDGAKQEILWALVSQLPGLSERDRGSYQRRVFDCEDDAGLNLLLQEVIARFEASDARGASEISEGAAVILDALRALGFGVQLKKNLGGYSVAAMVAMRDCRGAAAIVRAKDALRTSDIVQLAGCELHFISEAHAAIDQLVCVCPIVKDCLKDQVLFHVARDHARRIDDIIAALSEYRNQWGFYLQGERCRGSLRRVKPVLLYRLADLREIGEIRVEHLDGLQAFIESIQTVEEAYILSLELLLLERATFNIAQLGRANNLSEDSLRLQDIMAFCVTRHCELFPSFFAERSVHYVQEEHLRSALFCFSGFKSLIDDLLHFWNIR